MLRSVNIFLITATLLAALACSTAGDLDDLIPEDTYIDLLAELHLMSAIENTYPDSTLRDDAFEQVLLQYNITAEAFENSHEYYFQDIQGQWARLDEANRRLDEELTRISDITNRKQEERRSGNGQGNDEEDFDLEYQEDIQTLDDAEFDEEPES